MSCPGRIFFLGCFNFFAAVCSVLLCLSGMSHADTPSSQSHIPSSKHAELVTPVALSAYAPIVPVMSGREYNPILCINIETDQNPQHTLNGIELDFTGTTDIQDIRSVRVFVGGKDPDDKPGNSFGQAVVPQGSTSLTVKGDMALKSGINRFWISVQVSDTTPLDHVIAVRAVSVSFDSRSYKIDVSPVSRQKIGRTVARPGHQVDQDGRMSRSFRIPAMVRTTKGTLIAAYDIRYEHHRDLPADIDIGVRRSEDGGLSWGPLRVALSCKMLMKRKANDGCGDPAILVDKNTGRIWIAGIWGRGFHPIWQSRPGLTSPDDSGQMMLTYSDDDGKTWSSPINITKQVKNIQTGTGADWCVVFQGPGNGICTKNGILVFPAQYWIEEQTSQDPNVRRSYSTLIWSKDQGKTWNCGTGIAVNTSEAQVVELKDGSLMLNARNESQENYRVIGITRDLGKTWMEHPTSRNKNKQGLIEPRACQASIISNPDPGPYQGIFLFSNPAHDKKRQSMTIKVSKDEGRSWPAKWHTLYDERVGFGYSSLAPVDAQHVGVLYEGNNGYIYFLKFAYHELIES